MNQPSFPQILFFGDALQDMLNVFIYECLFKSTSAYINDEINVNVNVHINSHCHLNAHPNAHLNVCVHLNVNGHKNVYLIFHLHVNLKSYFHVFIDFRGVKEPYFFRIQKNFIKF